MLHCYDCGANMPDNMRFCTSCGRKLDISDLETQVIPGAAPPTTPYATNPATQPTATLQQKKRGGALKAVVIAVAGLVVLGVIVVVAGVAFYTMSRRQTVTVNTSLPNRSSNIAASNVEIDTDDTNAIIDNAMKQIQKAANDALAAANQASNVAGSAGKPLDSATTRIKFAPGATSSTAVGTVEGAATFVLRAKSGQKLTGKIISPNSCIKFEDEGVTTTIDMEDGENYFNVINSCSKPTSMVLSVSVK
jgi:hypothetical protein